ncbi:pyridoxal 5'-phosphate synthase glutaminase subunit PdxT [Ferrimicrobium sp.]|uniref:pyridoxal 5'-phosphate synthase glutaminase subunit PdxT n=1 Tax=Ferrimicrobium sp. TaxID=2926050 RepID=UPI002602880C|nr:pyridoxal 5'-phosphate synthase glutaminase subunit PdxT [Ferrimicrobium sp.]
MISIWRIAAGRGQTTVRIGVLALQGDFSEHLAMVAELGWRGVPVKEAADLVGLDGLVLPGGESTAQCLLLEASGLRCPITEELRDGLPALGTCAGLIMLSRTVIGGREDQWSFGVLDVAVRRNGFGRQVRSFEANLVVEGLVDVMRAVFIRAPVITEVGDKVEVLASVPYRFPDGTQVQVPVVVAEGSLVASSFHPELAGDPRLHELAFGRSVGRSIADIVSTLDEREERYVGSFQMGDDQTQEGRSG